MNNLKKTPPRKKVGIVYHGRLEVAMAFSEELAELVSRQGATVWRATAAQENEIARNATDSDLVLAVGGDGTLLRAARGVAGCHAPLVGINLGKLGFMTEISAAEIDEKLPRVLAGEGWIDTRALLDATVETRQIRFLALNDVVVARGGTCRIIRVEVRIDGALLTTYRADGVILATATGSTSYALAAGGPIVHPQAREILLQPISPHLSLSRCLMLSPDATVQLTVATDRPATLSVDGQVDVTVPDGERITVRLSDKVVKFLRLHPPTHFYESLTQKLKGESFC